jgi:putative nucleotidyltransferase with HDIG domain
MSTLDIGQDLPKTGAVLVYDARFEPQARRLAASHLLDGVRLEDLRGDVLAAAGDVIFYIDLGSIDTARQLRARLGGAPPKPRNWIFVLASGRERHASKVQADALGATGYLGADTVANELSRLLSIAGRTAVPTDRIAALRRAAGGETVLAAGKAMADLFGSFSSGGSIVGRDIGQLGSEIARSVGSVGASDWLATVRNYHEGTFQHCLLVAGAAASYANEHIADRAEAARMASAALLHDIGKASVPLHVLDKPGKLSAAEFEAIKRHPAAGFDHLVRQPGMDDAVLDAVRHHHEALDGSGYPDGLKAAQILPLTRILTVCDIYAALTEARSYKSPNPPEEAIPILVRMALENKVDYVPVRNLARIVGMRVPETLAEVRSNLERQTHAPAA